MNTFQIQFFAVLVLLVSGLGSVRAQAQGSLDSQTTVTVDQLGEGDQSVQLDAITIDTGLEKRRSDLITAPGSFVMKGRETIEATPNGKLSDVLTAEPNVNFYGGPRGGAQLPQIRGMQSERILILDEGVRQNYQSQHTGRVFTDFSMIENVEVVKGPWSSLYGSGAMGGVISYRRATAGDYLKRANVHKSKYLGAEVSFDSAPASDGSGQRMTVFGRVNKWEPLISYKQASNGDVRLSTGEELKYSANKVEDLYTSQSFQLSSKQALNLKINSFTDKGRIPLNPILNHTNLNQIGDSTATKQDVVADYQYRGQQADFHFRPSFRQTTVERVRVSDGRADIQGTQTTGADTWVTVDNVWGENLRSTVTAGVEVLHDVNKGERNGAQLNSFPNGTSDQAGVYLQPSMLIGEKWTITPGIRYDSFRNEIETAGVKSNSGEQVSGKLYTSFEHHPDKKIFAGWGQAFNAPRLQDIYLSDMHFPGNFFVPNPDLKSEESYTVEVGTQNIFRVDSSNAVAADLTLFETQARDFISRDVKATTTQMMNLDRVELKGYEATVGWQGMSHAAKLGYGQVRSRDLSSDQPLKDTPADQWTLSLELFAGDTLRLGTELVVTEKQDQVPTILKPGDLPVAQTAGYSVQNVFIQYKTLKGVTVNGRINNMWDREYQPHGENIPQVGRDLRAGLSWMF
ncbi:MAG: TonB-dependent receptor [Bdellovibrionales bacterium]|nr:TonB-dependent receptor [Bdellovibrionales bacterium]